LGARLKICILGTASDRTPWADITLPNRAEYCRRHGYTMSVIYAAYEHSVIEHLRQLSRLLGLFDLVWTLGIDCLITDMTQQIECVPDLGDHVTVCEEGLGAHTLLNNDSMVWRSTDESRGLVNELIAAEPEWSRMNFLSQDWLMFNSGRLDCLEILPMRTLQSVHHQQTCHWQPGDFVYHPCGAPRDERCEMLRQKLGEVRR
jgi:hypothetical protein